MRALDLLLLDSFWRRTVRPRRVDVELVDHGAVTEVRITPRIGHRPLLATRCYLVDDTLVDCGPAPARDAVVALAREAGVRQVLLTHHHEDHAGNAAALTAAGVTVRASAATRRLVARRLPIRFYQHLMWGAMEPCPETSSLDGVTIGGREVVVIPAPGHAVDQVVFHVPSDGWLFSGDAFLGERVRVFRGDEDYAAIVATVRLLAALDVRRLFCAHAPRLEGGRAALAAKLADLESIGDRIHRWHREGQSERTMARRLRPRRLDEWLTAGDAGPRNLVRAVLARTRQRPEVAAALANDRAAEKPV